MQLYLHFFPELGHISKVLRSTGTRVSKFCALHYIQTSAQLLTSVFSHRLQQTFRDIPQRFAARYDYPETSTVFY